MPEVTAAVNGRTEPVIKKQNQFLEVLKRLSRNKSATAGMIIFLFVLFVAIFGEALAPHDYAAVNPSQANIAPCADYWFGTDNMGRDIFSRVLVGCKWSLIIGIGAQLIACFGGIVLGCIAGFFGGKVDQVIMRLCDVVQSIPSVLLNITLAGIFGPGLFNTILALGLSGITGGTRLMRSSIMTVRKKEYLEAATAINCSNFRIILKHALPNSFAPMIVSFTMSIGSGIIGASALTYLGLGVQPPNPEWGALVTAGRNYLKTAPYMTLIPGACILIVVLALNLFGDGLRDALDPKLKK
ncbi:MAG: ABC transporter permease [Candidatus Onthomonas sp.]